ncbi:MAG: hypothetical protein KAT13_01890 [Methanosarcinales archaeon]|nr:hypothetical protein [Methanosarcinales archaeon]
MKLTSITWGSDVPLLAEACAKLGIALSAWTPRDLEDGEKRDRCTQMLGDADVILLRPTNDWIWDEIIERLDQDIPIISFGYDPSFWQLSNVPLKITAAVNAYHVYGGSENIENMLKYIGNEVLGM